MDKLAHRWHGINTQLKIMKNKKDTSVIPQGLYCYTYKEDGEYYLCPYYKDIEDSDGHSDAYCEFLEKSDIDIAVDSFNSPDVIIRENGKELDKSEVPDFVFMGLLWDQVKECEINIEE